MITGHVPAVYLPPDHAGGLMAAANSQLLARLALSLCLDIVTTLNKRQHRLICAAKRAVAGPAWGVDADLAVVYVEADDLGAAFKLSC
jgi:hypothetical protein